MPKLLIAGDFVPRYRVASLIDNKDYQTVLGEVKHLIEEADLSIVNLEAPVIYGKPTPITKTGPNLSCTENAVEALRWAGFDCVTLANNHLYDQGEQGVEGTLKACEKYGMLHVGGGKNLNEAEHILYKEIDGRILAIINCCEHEWSIASDEHGGSNPLNPIKQYYAIKEARQKADYVLVIVHGGIEMYQYPTPRMQETYRFFVDAGADAVVNHHQHCYSGYEVYNGKPIFYGLGNFCFDKNDGEDNIWNYGNLLVLIFGEGVSFKLVPYKQCIEQPAVILLESNSFDDVMGKINKSIMGKDELFKCWNAIACRDSEIYLRAFEPFQGHWISALRRRHLFPTFITEKILCGIKSNIQCESHRERLLSSIDKKLLQ